MMKYVLILIGFISFSMFIIVYNKNLIKKYGEKYPQYDYLNKNLGEVLHIKCCFWNLSHVFIYFFICVLVDARLKLYKHLLIMLFGLFWYHFAIYKDATHHPVKTKDIVYRDTNIPRLDDIVFNTSGQLIYCLFYLLTQYK